MGVKVANDVSSSIEFGRSFVWGVYMHLCFDVHLSDTRIYMHYIHIYTPHVYELRGEYVYQSLSTYQCHSEVHLRHMILQLCCAYGTIISAVCNLPHFTSECCNLRGVHEGDIPNAPRHS